MKYNCLVFFYKYKHIEIQEFLKMTFIGGNDREHLKDHNKYFQRIPAK